MEKNCFSIALRNLLTEKAVLLVHLTNGKEEVIKCANIESAKALREELLATRQDVSLALVGTEAQYKNFLAM